MDATGFAGGMDKRDLPFSSNTPISQKRKGANEVTVDEAALSPQQERFMKRKQAIERAEEKELWQPPKLQHVTMGEPARNCLASTPNAALLPASSGAISGGELLDKQLPFGGDVDVHSDDIDKQRLRWEAVDEEQQVWDAINEQQHKSRKKETRQKPHEMRKKENKKKRKLEVDAKGKKENKKKREVGYKPEEGEPKMTKAEVQGRGSPLARIPLMSLVGNSPVMFSKPYYHQKKSWNCQHD